MSVFHKIQTYHNKGLLTLTHVSAANNTHSNWVGENLRLLFPITLLHNSKKSKPVVVRIFCYNDSVLHPLDHILESIEWEKVKKVMVEIHVDEECDEGNELSDPVLISQIAGLSKWHELFWVMAQKLSEGYTKIQSNGIKVQCITVGNLPEACWKDNESGDRENQQVHQEIMALEPIRPAAFLLGLTEHGSFVKIGKMQEMQYRYGGIKSARVSDPGELMIDTDHGSYSFREAGCESK